MISAGPSAKKNEKRNVDANPYTESIQSPQHNETERKGRISSIKQRLRRKLRGNTGEKYDNTSPILGSAKAKLRKQTKSMKAKAKKLIN